MKKNAPFPGLSTSKPPLSAGNLANQSLKIGAVLAMSAAMVACQSHMSEGVLSPFAIAARENPSADPFVGIFVLTGDNIQTGPGRKYTHARLEITRDWEWVTKTIVFYNDGEPELRFGNRMREDGRDYAGLADNPNTMSIERTSARSVRMTEKHNGHPVERYEELLSPDGETLTVSHARVDQTTGATTRIWVDIFHRAK